jgi:RNA polymerase sigma-70 factor (ECF subfamily)
VDEAAAIARLKQHDIGGLELLVQRYQVQAVRAAYLITRDRPLAEDIVQTAFLRAYERIHQFDARRPFGPWFLQSVIHDAVKASARRERQTSLDDADADHAPLTWLADPAPGPEELLVAGETREAIWTALEALAPAQRAAVVQRYYLDRSEAEMAVAGGSPPGTVKWRLHAARKRLQALLQPHHAPSPVAEALAQPHSDNGGSQ